MNEIMSYQYPPPGTPPPPYNAGYPVAPHATGMGMRSPDQPGRTGGSPTMPFDLKRSNSHPNIKMDSTSLLDEANMATAAEKKRSKLGYHRASTACTCCRRRKIRCQPGSQGQHKCKTCEKLNKDCKYESVSHDGQVDSRHASISRASAGHRLASASSSPAVSNGHPVDIHSAQQHGHMTMPPIQHMVLTDPPDLKMVPGAMARSAYPEYGSQGIAPSWIPSDGSAGSSRTKHTSWGSYSHDSTPITPNFPSYNHTTPSSPQAAGGWAGPEPAARNGMSWGSYAPAAAPPPPSNNQSFSPMAHQMATPAGAYDRKTPTGSSMPAAEMYPPIPNMTPGPTGMGAAAAPPPPQHQHQHQPQTANYGSWGHQQSYPPISKPGEGYGGGWYSQGETGHAQPAMTHGLPVAEGYYAQR